MRRILVVLSLAGLTVLASASDAFAQLRFFGGGWGNGSGFTIGVGRGGYYSPYGYYGGLGYSPFYQGYGYSSAPSYYYGTPGYPVYPATNYAEPAVLAPAHRSIRRSTPPSQRLRIPRT